MEKNFVIYKELVKAAAKVFDEGITAPVGTYTLSELSKIGTTAKTAPKGVYFHKGYNADNIINIIVDGFKCSLPAHHIFLIARRFETLAKVGAKDRAAFTRAMKHGELVAVFTLDAVTVENLAACEDPHQGIRPQMQGVFCDISAGLSCCSDGYALNVARLPDAQVMNADTLNDGGVILRRAFAKTAKGCKVSIYKEGVNLRAVASNGASCEAVAGKYPNYKAVFSHVDESRPVRFNKNAKELKKAVAAVAKIAGGENVFLSGLNADRYIIVSANGEGGEISRRVALAAPLAFNFAVCCKAENVKCINESFNILYIAKFRQIVFAGLNSLSLLSLCSFKDFDLTKSAAAAYQLATPGAYKLNIFAAFVAPVEDATEDTDNAEHVAPRRVLSDWLKVAAVLLLAFVLRSISTSNSEAAAPSTNSRAAVVDVEPLQVVEILDTLDVAPVVPVDSIQTVETADTLHVAPVAPADSIQAVDSTDTADTLHVAPVAPADSIQTVETADTLHVAPVAPAKIPIL